MRTPALAIAWEFRQRHRWGIRALAGYLFVLVITRAVIAAFELPVQMDSPFRFALVVVVPLATTFGYFLAVFTYGLSGDLAARESMYPARMFTLPVTNAALAGWPMLYGTVAMTMLWLATRLLAFWPEGVAVPVVWPAVAAASLLAWTQALTWLPYGLRGLRVIVSVLWLGTIDALVLIALELKAPEPLMLAILAPHIPLAYIVARVAVARARRGDVPDWSGWIANVAGTKKAARSNFASPARAQLWFEWRQHGWSLPVMVGIVLPFQTGLLFVVAGSSAMVLYTLVFMLLTPPIMAAFAAAAVRTSNPHHVTLPMSTAALIGAKLKLTIGSTLVTWLLVGAMLPLALALTDTWPTVTAAARTLSGAIGEARAVALVALLVTASIVSTWKLLVQSLYIGLTGHDAVIKGSAFMTLTLLAIIGPVINWIVGSPDVLRVLWDNLPRIVVALVALKLSAVVLVAWRLYQSRQVSDFTLLAGAAIWTLAVFALYGALTWFFASPFIPNYMLALAAILAMPLARVSAAPLALAWNRHR